MALKFISFHFTLRKVVIIMANPFNSFNTVGRLVDDPKIIANADGSKRTYVKLALTRDYQTNGKYEADFIDFEGFIPAPKADANGNVRTYGGVYEYMKKGQFVALNFEMRSCTYQAKDDAGNPLVKEDGTPKMTGRTYNHIREIKLIGGNKKPEAAETEKANEPAEQAA